MVSARVLDNPWGLVIGYDTIATYDLTAAFHEIFVKEEVIPLELVKEGSNTNCPKPTNKSMEDAPSPIIREQRKKSKIPRKVQFENEPARAKCHSPSSIVEWMNILRENADEVEGEEILQDGEVNSLLPDVTDMLPEKEGGSREGQESDELLPKMLGNSEFHQRIRDVCRKRRNVFCREVRKTPANLPPLILEVDTRLWEVKSNRAQPRPQSVEKTLEIIKQVNRMLELDIIERSVATAWSQVLLVPKPGSKWRFCIDFRNLNAVLTKKGWPIPNIKRMLQRLGEKKAEYYGLMDLTSGFHQCQIADGSRQFTAFITDMGTFQWKRVPMGIATAPSYFQRAIAGTVMDGLMYECMEMYIDDMLVYC